MNASQKYVLDVGTCIGVFSNIHIEVARRFGHICDDFDFSSYQSQAKEALRPHSEPAVRLQFVLLPPSLLETGAYGLIFTVFTTV